MFVHSSYTNGSKLRHLGPIEHPAIGLHHHAGGFVAQGIGHLGIGRALVDKMAAHAMAAEVGRSIGDARCGDRGDPAAAAEIVGVDLFAPWGRENQVCGFKPRSGRQHGDDVGLEVEGIFVVGFWGLNRDGASGEVDLMPAQHERLAGATADVNQEHHHIVIVAVVGVVFERLEDEFDFGSREGVPGPGGLGTFSRRDLGKVIAVPVSGAK